MMNRKRIKEIIPEKACEYCWDTFTPNRFNQKFCSKECGIKNHNQKLAIIRDNAIIEGTSSKYLKLRFTVLRRDKFTCQYCGRTPQDGAKLQIDHIKPKSNNGEYAINNLITACFECNSGKRDVILSERERIKLKSITRTS